MKFCNIKNCYNKYYSRNMCNKHYARWYRKTENGKITYIKARNKYQQSEKGKITWAKYYNSKEYKELVKKLGREYYHTKNGKESRTKYLQSEKGRKYTQTYYRKYRNRKLGAEGSHTTEEWKQLIKQYPKCVSNWICDPNNKLTEDHIIPLSKGGTDWINNIQPICRPCNAKKGTQTINFLHEMVINV